MNIFVEKICPGNPEGDKFTITVSMNTLRNEGSENNSSVCRREIMFISFRPKLLIWHIERCCYGLLDLSGFALGIIINDNTNSCLRIACHSGNVNISYTIFNKPCLNFLSVGVFVYHFSPLQIKDWLSYDEFYS